MSDVNVFFLYWFIGELTIDNENKPTYIDKILKSMPVRKSTTRRELVEKIHHIAKINPNDYQILLTCKWQIAHEHYQEVKISKDEDICFILELYPSINTIELYVEKDYVSHQLPEGYGEVSRMLDLDNESMGVMSLVQRVPRNYKSQIFLAYNT